MMIRNKGQELCEGQKKTFSAQANAIIETKIIDDECKKRILEKKAKKYKNRLEVLVMKYKENAEEQFALNDIETQFLNKFEEELNNQFLDKSTPMDAEKMKKIIKEEKTKMLKEIMEDIGKKKLQEKLFDEKQFKQKMKDIAQKHKLANGEKLRNLKNQKDLEEQNKRIRSLMLKGGLIGAAAGVVLAPALVLGVAAAVPALLPAAAGVAILSTPIRAAAVAAVSAGIGGIVGGGGGSLIGGKNKKKKNEDEDDEGNGKSKQK